MRPFVFTADLARITCMKLLKNNSAFTHLADFGEKREEVDDILGVGLIVSGVNVEQQIGYLCLKSPLRFCNRRRITWAERGKRDKSCGNI